MRAALFRINGSPEVLEIGEVSEPEIASDEVLVRVWATSVNPVDCYIRRGGLRRFARVPFPITPGVDVSGTVAKTGSNVRSLRVGDEVYGFIPLEKGASAEFVACREEWLSRKPEHLSHPEAAVIPCVGLTAFQALRDRAQLSPGQSVLINGASGGVGSMAVQIACAMGLEAVAVCSTPHLGLVRTLGATRAIDYLKQEILTDARQRFDAIFDCVGNHGFWKLSKLLKLNGRHVGISCTRKAVLASVLSQLSPGRKSFQFHVQASRRDLDQLRKWMEQGLIKSIISHVFPLERIADGHRQCETRHTSGKIAITVQ